MKLRRTVAAAALSALIIAPLLVSSAPFARAEVKKSTAPRPLMEMVFVLDTTGSMGGLLDGAKAKIWDIVNGVMKMPADKRPEVRIGLVAFRDHGDDYVTRVLPITSDLDKVYATLMDYTANGGGDGPEDVRQALADGVSKAGWSARGAANGTGQRIVQTLFLVGDAPPHDDYANEPDVLATTANAVRRGIYINTIQCGSDGATTSVWQSIARRGEGQFFAIAQNGGVQAVATPYDEKLAKLGAKMGTTYTAFGGGAGGSGAAYRKAAAYKNSAMEMRVEAASAGPSLSSGGFGGGGYGGGRGFGGSAPKAASAPAYSAAAGRAVNKALNSRAYDDSDLLTAIENGSAKLGKVKQEDLPDDLRKLSPAARKAAVDKRLAERKKLRAEILALSKKRDAFQRSEREKSAKGKGNGFDAAVTNALKTQAKKRGIGL